MTEQQQSPEIEHRGPTLEVLWEKSDAETREIIENPQKHPLAFFKLVWAGEYVPPSLQRCYEALGRLRPW